jgi:hypothetical protein
MLMDIDRPARVTSFALGITMMIFGPLACSSDDTNLVAESMAALCNAYCDTYPKQIEGCPAETNYSAPTQTCKSQCAIYRDTNDCRTEMQAYASCNAQRTFECAKGSTLYAVVGDDPCDALEDAFGITPSVPGSGGRCVDPNQF